MSATAAAARIALKVLDERIRAHLPAYATAGSACRAVSSLSIFLLVRGARFEDDPFAMKLIFFSGFLTFCVGAIVATEAPKSVSALSSESPRAQVTVENWDKGGALSHWVYTHVSEVFPSAVVRRGGAIVNLPIELKPEIGALKLKNANGSEQTLEQFVNDFAGVYDETAIHCAIVYVLVERLFRSIRLL